MLALLFYGYAAGDFHQQELEEREQATYELIPVIYITPGNTSTRITTALTPFFRKRFLEEMKDLFTQILLWLMPWGALRLGDVSLDGTKIHAKCQQA